MARDKVTITVSGKLGSNKENIAAFIKASLLVQGVKVMSNAPTGHPSESLVYYQLLDAIKRGDNLIEVKIVQEPLDAKS